MNKQMETYSEKRKEEIAQWVLDGAQIYQDDIEYVGDWIYISVYLPE